MHEGLPSNDTALHALQSQTRCHIGSDHAEAVLDTYWVAVHARGQLQWCQYEVEG